MKYLEHEIEDPGRRDALKHLGVIGALSVFNPLTALARESGQPGRVIPSSGEAIPAVGLGSWQTFNVGHDQALRDECTEVVRAFFATGGKLIDSSPMYGSSQEVIGYALDRLGGQSQVFSADKVWTSSGSEGPQQIEQSRRYWGVESFDLLQVHNLLEWETHLPMLLRMKDAGRLRYVGVTTSHGRRHGELESVMKSRRFDFVQLTYNPVDREAERSLLPLARERGMAVITNRPFQGGDLIRRTAREPLPGWATELGARSWAQIILKFIISHPAVTCAIPATTVPAHARENVQAARGPMPDDAMRRRIASHIAGL